MGVLFQTLYVKQTTITHYNDITCDRADIIDIIYLIVNDGIIKNKSSDVSVKVI